MNVKIKLIHEYNFAKKGKLQNSLKPETYTPHRCTVHFVELLQLSTNKCTYIKFHIKTLKIALTYFDPKIILRELRCSLLKSF